MSDLLSTEEARDSWGSKIGLILAMAGNAVGLGNFWRFPYQAAQNGGGAFMVPYFIALVVLGLPIMISEWHIGKFGGRYGHGTLAPMMYLQAREGMKPKKALVVGSICGGIAFAVTLLINSYYNHIVGWTLNYSFMSATGGYMDHSVTTSEIFSETIQNPFGVFLFWILALIGLAFAVSKGIKKGIESWAKIMMPVLYCFGIFLAIRALTLGSPVNPDWSALKGLEYVWNPDWSHLTWTGTLSAAGQIFFTLSLGMGLISHYASYLKPDDDIVVSSIATISLNEFAEVILAATIVIPISFAYLGEAGLTQGIGLAFVSLPNVFRDMAFGNLFGAAWFLLLFFAGFTSSLAMFSYLTTLLEEDIGVKRRYGSWCIFGCYILFGLPVALEPILTKTDALAYFTEVDNWIGQYLILFLGLIELLILGWFVGKKALPEINRGGIWKLPRWFFSLLIRFVAPITLSIVIVFSTLQYINQGYFNLMPEYLSATPELIPWALLARGVVLFVVAGGIVISYISIKRKYGDEIRQNKVLIRK